MKKIIIISLLFLSFLSLFSEVLKEDIIKNPKREVTTYTTSRVKDRAIMDLTVKKLNIRPITYSSLDEKKIVFELNKLATITSKYLITTSISLIPREVKVNGRGVTREKTGVILNHTLQEKIDENRDILTIGIDKNYQTPFYISRVNKQTGELLEVYEYKDSKKTKVMVRSGAVAKQGNTPLGVFYLGAIIPGETNKEALISMNAGTDYTTWFNGVSGGLENEKIVVRNSDLTGVQEIDATLSMWWDIGLVDNTIYDIWRFETTKQMSGVSDPTTSDVVHKVLYAADWRVGLWTSIPKVALYQGFQVNISVTEKNIKSGFFGIKGADLPRKVYTSDKIGNTYDVTTPGVVEFLVQREHLQKNLSINEILNPTVNINGKNYNLLTMENLRDLGYSSKFNFEVTGKDVTKGIKMDTGYGLLIPTELGEGEYEIQVIASSSEYGDKLQYDNTPDTLVIRYTKGEVNENLILDELNLYEFEKDSWGRWKNIFRELIAYAGTTNTKGENYSFKNSRLPYQDFDLKSTKRIKLYKEGVFKGESTLHVNDRVEIVSEDLGFGTDGGNLLGEFFIDKKGYEYFGDAEYELEFFDDSKQIGGMNISIIKDRGINIGEVAYEIDGLLLEYMQNTGAEQFFIGMSSSIGDTFPENKYQDLIMKRATSINQSIGTLVPTQIVNVTENPTANFGYKMKPISRKIGAGLSYNRLGTHQEIIYFGILDNVVSPSDIQDKIIFNLKCLNEGNLYSDSFYTGFQINDGRTYEMKYEFIKSNTTSYKKANYYINTTDFEIGEEYIFDLTTGKEVTNDMNSVRVLGKVGEAFEYRLLGNATPDMGAFSVEELSSKLSVAGLENYSISLEKDELNRRTLLKIQKNSSVKISDKSIEGKINFYDITVGKVNLTISDEGPSFELIDNGELDFGILTYDPYNTYVKGEKIFSVKNSNSYPITFSLVQENGELKHISNSNSRIPIERMRVVQNSKLPNRDKVNTFLLEGYAKPYRNMVSGEYTGEITIEITIDTTSSN